VLLVLSNGPSEFHCGTNNSIMSNLANYLIETASSPYIRSAPLVLVFLSSAAFIAGVIIIRDELSLYGNACCEILGKIKMNLISGKKKIDIQLEKTIDCIDTMVADDIIRTVVRAGNETVAGLVGGYALYSLPDRVLQPSLSNNKCGVTVQMQNKRRAFINTMDPSFDDILFQPGGLWNVVPGFREHLTSFTKLNAKHITAGIMDAPTVDSTANESGSEDEDKEEKISETNEAFPSHIHVSQHQQHEDESLPASASRERTMRDSYGDAKKAPPLVGTTSNHRPPKFPIPPSNQFEKILRRMAVAATLCFFMHLHKSPSTRKTWKSAIHFFTSCGLLSTAISTGLASVMSSSMNGDSIVGSICIKALQSIACLPNSKLCELFEKIRNMIKTNRQLQIAVAFSVMYGFKRSYAPGRKFLNRLAC